MNIPLEIGVAEKNFEKLQEEKSALQSKVFDLEKENAQLNKGLEELDTQHNDALRGVLDIKEEIQVELSATKVSSPLLFLNILSFPSIIFLSDSASFSKSRE